LQKVNTFRNCACTGARSQGEMRGVWALQQRTAAALLQQEGHSSPLVSSQFWWRVDVAVSVWATG